VRRFTQTLAILPVPGLLRDCHFQLALLAALPFWLGLWFWPEAPLGQGLALWPLLYLVLITPAVEELAFRGALQGAFLDAPWGHRRRFGISHANMLVTVLFCAVHLIHHPPLWAAAVVVPSLVFGHLRERTGSILPPLLVHGWYNGGYLLVTSLS